jgi:hypothetical protein
MYTGTAPAPLREVRYEGVHCDLVLSQLAREVVLLRITGTDVGEFGEAPMKALTEWISETSGLEFFIDAREVRGASIAVSGDWAAWLSAHRQALRSVTMLTGSKFIQVTAEFVRRFSSLQGIMRICTETLVFDAALAYALNPRLTS